MGHKTSGGELTRADPVAALPPNNNSDTHSQSQFGFGLLFCDSFRPVSQTPDIPLTCMNILGFRFLGAEKNGFLVMDSTCRTRHHQT